MSLNKLTVERPLTSNPSPLTFTHPSPNTELLAIDQCEFQAIKTHNTALTYLLRFFSGSTPLGKKEIGIDPETIRIFLP